MKNKIALKLTLYFSAVLVVFALIIGGVFYQFFKEHTVEIKKAGDARACGKNCCCPQR